MTDMLMIWQNFINLTVQLWNFLVSFNNGLVIALIVVSIMLLTIKKIFFTGEDRKE